MTPETFLELLKRYQASFGDLYWAWGAAFLIFPALAYGAFWVRGRLSARWLSHVVLAAVAAGAVVWAWSLLWVSDDAYISFRYARNLVAGEGLVFNPGERVEGYTNFLWTLFAAAAIAVGVHPAHATVFLSLCSFVSLLWLVESLGRRLVAQAVSSGPIGLGTVILGLNYTVASFATSGLETVFAAMCAVLALDQAERDRPLVAGLAGIAATLAHPDHAVFYAALGGALLLDRARRKQLIVYAIPFLAIYVPYFLWRWSYFGELMPNTYYAKSGSQAYFRQGAAYLLVGGIGLGLWGVLPLAGLGAVLARRTLAGRAMILGLPLYLVYVAKIGGDFMHGRLLIPAIALLLVWTNVGSRSLIARKNWRAVVPLAGLASVAAIPTRIVRPGEIYHGIADERTFTPVTRITPIVIRAAGFELGHELSRTFADAQRKPKVALFSLGMASYYAENPVFDLRGLTSRSVAHLPLERRGRPGHEKVASPGHVLEAGVELSEMPVYPEPYAGLAQVQLGAFRMHLVRYEPSTVHSIRQRGRVRDFARYLDGWAKSRGRSEPERLACDLWHMKEYYFSVNADEARRQRVARAAVQKYPELAPLENVLLEGRDGEALGWTRVQTESFDDGAMAWSFSGEARDWPRSVVLPGQGQPFGHHGAFLNTFTPGKRDGARGRALSRPFVIQGDRISFRIAGGMDLGALYLALLVDGAEVVRATGCDSEWLDFRFWDVRTYRGRKGQFAIVDESERSWGHLLVDEIVEWQTEAPGEPSTPVAADE